MVKKQRLLAQILLLVFSMALAVQAQAKTKLVVMDWKQNETQSTQAFFQQVKEQFEASHPDVEIEYAGVTFGQVREKVMTQAAAGTAPDVVSLSVLWARELWDTGLLLDLNQYVQKTPELDPKQFIPTTQVYNQVNGRIYGITNAMDENLLVYNLDHFDEAGLNGDPYALQSWTDLKNAAKKLTLVDGSGATTRWGLNMSSNVEPFTSFLTSNGSMFYNGNFTRANFNNKPAWEVAEFFADVNQAKLNGGNFEKRTNSIWMRNNAAPYFLAQNAPDLRYNLTSVPKGPSGKGRGTTVWGNMYSITNSSKNPQLAWEFIKFYCGLQGNINMFKSLSYVQSPRLDFYKSKEWIEARKKYSWMQMVPEAAYVGGPYAFLEYTKMRSVAWVPYIEKALKGEAPIQSSFEQAQLAYDNLLQEVPSIKKQQ